MMKAHSLDRFQSPKSMMFASGMEVASSSKVSESSCDLTNSAPEKNATKLREIP